MGKWLTFVYMASQGNRLRNYFDEHGIKYLGAANKLGVHVNTLRNWMSLEKLPTTALNQLASTFPPLIPLFPEIQFWTINERQFKAANIDTLGQEDIDKRYQDLLNRYNDLLEKHVALQERFMLN